MLIGQTALAPTSGATCYTPWFPRQGNALTLVLEVMKASGAFDFAFDVQTKNQEDADSALTALGSGSSATAGTATLLVTGCLELVRYKFVLRGTGGSAVWVHFRSNAPQWQPN